MAGTIYFLDLIALPNSMNPDLTFYLAVYGMVLSTITAFFGIRKWLRDKPRIVVKVEEYEDPALGGINFEIRNRGDQPTTIEEIGLVKYFDGFKRCVLGSEHCEYVSEKYKATAKLPHFLRPGEVWKGYAPYPEEKSSSELNKPELIKAGRLFFKIRCAHSDRLVSGKVKPENLNTII